MVRYGHGKHRHCQSCIDGPIQYRLQGDGEGEDYYLCADCLVEIVNHALTPEHFFNLLNHGHVSSEFLLHSDFYDENGMELQSKFRMIDSLRG